MLPAAAADPEVTLLVRYVLDTPYFEAHEYAGYDWDVRRGTLVYDERYRRPSDPPATTISCSARRIGITFALRRRQVVQSSREFITVFWRHDGDRLVCDECVMSRSVYFSAGRRVEFLSYGLRLDDQLRQNGEFSVSVHAWKRELATTSFTMTGCS